MTHDAAGLSPVCNRNQDHDQSKDLPDFHTDIEEDEIGQQTVCGHFIIKDFRCHSKAMYQAEQERSHFGIGLNPEPALIRAHIIKGFIDNGKADNRINDVGTDADFHQHTRQQRNNVANRKQGDVDTNILHAIEEENHTEQEKQMVYPVIMCFAPR